MTNLTAQSKFEPLGVKFNPNVTPEQLIEMTHEATGVKVDLRSRSQVNVDGVDYAAMPPEVVVDMNGMPHLLYGLQGEDGISDLAIIQNVRNRGMILDNPERLNDEALIAWRPQSIDHVGFTAMGAYRKPEINNAKKEVANDYDDPDRLHNEMNQNRSNMNRIFNNR